MRIQVRLSLAALTVATLAMTACSSSGSARSGATDATGQTLPTATGAGAPSSSSAAAASTPATSSASSNKTLTGCGLVSQAEASSAAGVSLPAGTASTKAPSAHIASITGCTYTDHVHAIIYLVETIAAGTTASDAAAMAKAEVVSAGSTVKDATVGDYIGFVSTPPATATGNPTGVTGLYKGQVLVLVDSASVKPDAALAIATLITQRI